MHYSLNINYKFLLVKAPLASEAVCFSTSTSKSSTSPTLLSKHHRNFASLKTRLPLTFFYFLIFKIQILRVSLLKVGFIICLCHQPCARCNFELLTLGVNCFIIRVEGLCLCKVENEY